MKRWPIITFAAIGFLTLLGVYLFTWGYQAGARNERTDEVLFLIPMTDLMLRQSSSAREETLKMLAEHVVRDVESLGGMTELSEQSPETDKLRAQFEYLKMRRPELRTVKGPIVIEGSSE